MPKLFCFIKGAYDDFSPILCESLDSLLGLSVAFKLFCFIDIAEGATMSENKVVDFILLFNYSVFIALNHWYI